MLKAYNQNEVHEDNIPNIIQNKRTNVRKYPGLSHRGKPERIDIGRLGKTRK